ncbi:MAG: hypothetical protein R8F63_20560 [Acidimicrobiales bacterium]|jgi:hypothetical protein|nr:hypothetical protein [Acidimicrobiales bacterium]GJM36661.1 MAG: hypothetical protein DHS20C19_00280 [Acidimicrobiales bacterium]
MTDPEGLAKVIKLLVVSTDQLVQEGLAQRVNAYVHSDPPVEVFIVACGDQADARLTETTTRLELLGVGVSGEVGGSDVTAAVDSALSHFGAHRILVSASPSRIAQWFHRDLSHRLQNRTTAIVETIAEPVSGRPDSTD